MWRGDGNPVEQLCALEGVAGERRWRLFTCACARMHWEMFTAAGQRAVEAAERFVDDPTTGAAMREGCRWFHWATSGEGNFVEPDVE